MNKTLVTIAEFAVVLLVLLLLVPYLIHVGTTFYVSITDETPPPVHSTVTVAAVEPPPPVVLADTRQDQTEDNALARAIVQELAEQIYLGRHPGTPLPSLTIHPDVDTSASSSASGKTLVNVTMIDWPDGSFSEIYQPTYAWDPDGYAPLAQQLLGGTPAESTVDPAGAPLLDELAALTGLELAKEDVRVSALLQKNPLNSSEQEEAALLLTALAWRENAGAFSDTRTLMNRATAHLALAQALRGQAAPTWNGRVAEALLLAMAGREAEAQKKLEQMSALPSGPASLPVWIAALQLWLKENPQGTVVKDNSPLVLKLAWFQTLTRCLPDSVAVGKLQALGNLEKVPDWGRAVLSVPGGCSVENGHSFAESTRGLEFRELNEILKTEGVRTLNDFDLADDFSKTEPDTVSADAHGNVLYRIIGPETFKAATLRHLYLELTATERWMRESWDVPEQADFFMVRMNILFRCVPYYKLIDASYLPHQTPDGSRLITQMRADREVWEVSALSPGLAFRNFPDKASRLLLSAFYRKIVPFGTAYQLGNRLEAEAELTRFIAQNPEETRTLQPDIATTNDLLQRLAQLHPSSYALIENTMKAQAENFPDRSLPKDQALTLLQPFRDHNLHALDTMYYTYFSQLNEQEKRTLLTERVALDPDTYFDLGRYLRQTGREEEAAQADRMGVQKATDQVLVANALEPLVLYDEGHGQPAEAMQLAQQAAQVYSRTGICTLIHLQEKRGNWNEAENGARQLVSRYQDTTELIPLYADHADQFPGRYQQLLREVFPEGKSAVDLSTLTGPPEGGVKLEKVTMLTDAAGLQAGDIIVALDGSRVKNAQQYAFLRTENKEPLLDLIVWREDHYLSLKMTASEKHTDAPFVDVAGK